MTKIVMISDTHNNIVPRMPEGDILIHAGDLTNLGTVPEVSMQLKWLSSLKDRYTHIVFVAGNHDFLFEKHPGVAKALLEDNPDLIYLEDSMVELEGLKIWGSPVTPRFHNWAFNKDENIQNHWDIIPNDTDILITHGPPKYTLDYIDGDNVGCPLLSRKVLTVNPKLHIFGHIHFGAGIKAYPNAPNGGRYAINAAVTDGRNRLARAPIEMEI